MKQNARILVCYNSPFSIFPVYSGKPLEKGLSPNDTSEIGFINELNSVVSELQNYFIEVSSLSINSDVERVMAKITSFAPDAIFNFVEAVEGVSSYEYCMTGLYELLGIPYTGNLPSTLGNCLNKARTKNIFKSYNIPTPGFITVKPFTKISKKNFNLKFPVILKLLYEDASIGISELSVVDDFNAMNKQLEFLFDTYKQEVIIDEYIDGRELNIAILGGKILPVSEIKFEGLPSELPKIVTYEGKWEANSIYYKNTVPVCPADLNKLEQTKLENTALAAFHALNCRDYARVDVRLSKDKTPYVIEVNPNPDISSDSGFARAAAASGMKHDELLFTIAGFALARRKNDTKIKAG